MSTTTITLTKFLLARIAEDEAAAKLGGGGCGCQTEALPVRHGYRCPARVLAECQAKREVIEMSEDVSQMDLQIRQIRGESGVSSDPGYNDPPYGAEILRALALPYADHPDYRDEWRP